MVQVLHRSYVHHFMSQGPSTSHIYLWVGVVVCVWDVSMCTCVVYVMYPCVHVLCMWCICVHMCMWFIHVHVCYVCDVSMCVCFVHVTYLCVHMLHMWFIHVQCVCVYCISVHLCLVCDISMCMCVYVLYLCAHVFDMWYICVHMCSVCDISVCTCVCMYYICVICVVYVLCAHVCVLVWMVKADVQCLSLTALHLYFLTQVSNWAGRSWIWLSWLAIEI